MKIRGQAFVFDPNRRNPDDSPMTAGQQLFEAAYGTLPPNPIPRDPLSTAFRQPVQPQGGLPPLQTRDPVVPGKFNPVPTVTQQQGYDFERIKDEAPQVKGIHQRGMGITSPESSQEMLGTNGLSICVSPIAYSPSTKIGVLAHIDPPSDLDGFAKDFLSQFPNDGSPIELNFVGGLRESATEQEGQGNDSRRNLTEMLQQLHDRPDNDRFDIQSFDVMNRAHSTEIVLDTKTGHLYPDVGKAYDNSLDSNFREVPSGYSTKASAQLAEVLTTNGINKVRVQYDGLSSEWIGQEQNAIARGFINDTVGLLQAQGTTANLDEVRSAMSKQLTTLMQRDPQAMRGMENALKQAHGTKLDHTDTALQRDHSLARLCMEKIQQNPDDPEAAVQAGIHEWKDIQALRIAQAIATKAEELNQEVPSLEALTAAVRHGMEEKDMLAALDKMHAEHPTFEGAKTLEPTTLNQVMRTAQCMDAVAAKRRMTPETKQTLFTNLAPDLHRELASHPTVPTQNAADAVFDKLLDHGHLQKEQMGPGKRIGQAILNLDKHKPVEIGNAPTKSMTESVNKGVTNAQNRLNIGVGTQRQQSGNGMRI